MEQRGLKNEDLIGIIGDKTLVSKVINRERKLNFRMVKNLHDQMIFYCRTKSEIENE